MSAPQEADLRDCPITAHCFVSNRHTGEPGCRSELPCPACVGMLGGRCHACHRTVPA